MTSDERLLSVYKAPNGWYCRMWRVHKNLAIQLIFSGTQAFNTADEAQVFLESIIEKEPTLGEKCPKMVRI